MCLQLFDWMCISQVIVIIIHNHHNWNFSLTYKSVVHANRGRLSAISEGGVDVALTYIEGHFEQSK